MVMLNGGEAILKLLLESRLEVEDLRAQLEKVKEELEQRDAKRKAEEEKLAARQVLHNFNEKVLRLLIKLSGLSSQEFWHRYKVSNFGAIERHQDLVAAWPKVLDVLGLQTGTTPKALWQELKFVQEGLGVYVHTGAFDKLSFEEIYARTDLIFTGNLERCKATFLFFLNLSAKISGNLYD